MAILPRALLEEYPGYWLVFFDGASSGNPGPAVCAALVVSPKGKVIARRTKQLGVTTNNVAEYEGLILGLKLSLKLRLPRVLFVGDSKLVIDQMTGNAKVKNEKMKVLNRKAAKLLNKLAHRKSSESLQFLWVPRKYNIADRSCQRLMSRVKHQLAEAAVVL